MVERRDGPKLEALRLEMVAHAQEAVDCIGDAISHGPRGHFPKPIEVREDAKSLTAKRLRANVEKALRRS